MNTQNISTLKIHKLTQAQYDRELEAGRIDESALYLTPDEKIDLSNFTTKEYVDANLDDKITSPSVAQIGQTVVVKSIDDNGKPTEWEAINLPKENIFVQSDEPTDAVVGDIWVDLDEEGTNTSYSKAEIDAMMGSYINDIDTLIGGDA